MIARLFILAFLLFASRTLLQAAQVDGQVKSVTGDAVLVTPEGKTEKITTKTEIPPGSKIVTQDKSDVIIQWMPGAFSILYPDTKVQVTSLNYTKPATTTGTANRHVAIGLLSGSVFSHLTHNTGTSDFRVRTPAGVAAARGTDYIVTFSGGQMTVSVLADTVTMTLPSGKVVTATALFTYLLGNPAATGLSQNEITSILQGLANIGLSVTLQNINNPVPPPYPGTTTSGYVVTYTPPDGSEGFSFFIPQSVGSPQAPFRSPLSATPINSSDFVPPASH